MKNPIKMDDLGVPLFLETPIYLTFVPIGIRHGIPWIKTNRAKLEIRRALLDQQSLKATGWHRHQRFPWQPQQFWQSIQ